MAGSKTRFGFFGDGNGEEPPDSGERGAARTIIGRDLHLQQPPDGFPAPVSPSSPTPFPAAPFRVTPIQRAPTPSARVYAPMPEEITESVPAGRRQTPRQSRFARFLGRWTNSGRFVSRSQFGNSGQMDGFDDEDLEVPRDSTGRNVLLVLAIALVTFLITFAIVKVRQHYTSQEPAPQPAANAQVVEPRTAQTTPPPAPVPVAAPPPRPTAQGLPATVPSPPAPAPKASPLPRRAARTNKFAAEPPPHLQNELLPLAR